MDEVRMIVPSLPGFLPLAFQSLPSGKHITFDAVSILSLIAALLSILIAAIVMRHKRVDFIHQVFLLLNVSSFLWSFLQFIRMNLPVWIDPSGPSYRSASWITHIIMFVGISTVSTHWFLFGAAFFRKQKLTAGWRRMAAYAPLIWSAVFMASNPLHHLFFSKYEPDSWTYGAAFWAYSFASYILITSPIYWAVRLLEKRGHAVIVARDGREALEAFERERFDAVLMDVQMPEMNGLEATAAIREKERATSRYTPIIAMTAHAIKGDRERCMEAGMDGYIAKPIKPDEMFRVLEEFASEIQNAYMRNDKESLDGSAILERLGGDEDLLREVVNLFLEKHEKQLREIRDAIDCGDASRLEQAAHTLKGSLGNFHAHASIRTASLLEEMGRSGELDGAREALAEMERQIARLKPALTELSA